MEVFIEKENKTVDLDFAEKADDNGTYSVQELLVDLKINSEAVLVIVNNEAVLPDENLSETDIVKILSVVSGG